MFSKILEIKSETNRILKITLTKDNRSLTTLYHVMRIVFSWFYPCNKKILTLAIRDIKVFSQNLLIISKLKENKDNFFYLKNTVKQSKYY